MTRKMQRSAATRIVLLMIWMTMLNCGNAIADTLREEPPLRPVSQYVKPYVTYPIDAYDPWECLNRRIYIFNAKFDHYIYLPVVNAYETITPDFVEKRISNFFLNFSEIQNLTNSLLQLKANSFVITLGRVALNTTVGVLGFWDPATTIGIHRQDEDFGQTLGHYGLGPGPYIVLPILGPSTLRDTTGLIADAAVEYAIDPLNLNDQNDEYYWPFVLARGIDARHRHTFRYYQTGSPFEYDLIRCLYLKKRELQIAK